MRRSILATLAAASLTLAACAGGTSASPGTSSAGTASPGISVPGPTSPAGTVTLVTHDSFNIDPALIAQFEEENNVTVQQVAPGDAGALVNQLILTSDAPLGDAVFGVDNTFAQRAIDAGVFAPYFPTDANGHIAQLSANMAGQLTAIDYGDVCINADNAYFTDHNLALPVTLEDLTKPEYANLLVVTDPATSSPGLAFLVATVGAFGEDGFAAYWQQLKDNGVKVVSSWSDAYYVDFSGPSSEGDRPLVLSYASSPPFEVTDTSAPAPTSALLQTCFRQVEYAGVLAGAENPQMGAKLIDFLTSDAVQAQIPDTMYMYPASDAVDLPQAWVQYAPLSTDPFEVAPADIAAHRDEWIQTWTDVVVG